MTEYTNAGGQERIT